MVRNASFQSLYRKDQYLIKRWEKNYTDAEFHQRHALIIEELKHLLKQRKILTGKEEYCAALIFHHAVSLEDNQQAQKHEQIARKKGYKGHPHLKAQLTDKQLMLEGKKQRYGTQAYRTKKGTLKQWPVQKGITDRDRQAIGLPSLVDLKKHLES